SVVVLAPIDILILPSICVLGISIAKSTSFKDAFLDEQALVADSIISYFENAFTNTSPFTPAKTKFKVCGEAPLGDLTFTPLNSFKSCVISESTTLQLL